MAWLLLATTGALALLVLALGLSLLRLRVRLADVEARVVASPPSSDAERLPRPRSDDQFASLDDDPGYVITHLGEPETEPEIGSAAPVRVDATLFTDQLARESAVQLAALAHGVRRALSAESRHRIRFHMRQEVKRARKQRRAEMRIAHREWTARQRAAAAEPAAHASSAPAA